MTDTLTLSTLIQGKGTQRNGPGWALTLEAKLPQSRYATVLYGQDWADVDAWDVGDAVVATIRRGNLKTDKDPAYDTSFFWDLVSLRPPTKDMSLPYDDIADRPTDPVYDPADGPPPNPAAIGACANHAVDFIVAGILPLPEGRELIGWIREVRDRLYRDVNQAPLAPSGFCYRHNATCQQGKTGAWGHRFEGQWCIDGTVTDVEVV